VDDAYDAIHVNIDSGVKLLQEKMIKYGTSCVNSHSNNSNEKNNSNIDNSGNFGRFIVICESTGTPLPFSGFVKRLKYNYKNNNDSYILNKDSINNNHNVKGTKSNDYISNTNTNTSYDVALVFIHADKHICFQRIKQRDHSMHMEADQSLIEKVYNLSMKNHPNFSYDENVIDKTDILNKNRNTKNTDTSDINHRNLPVEWLDIFCLV